MTRLQFITGITIVLLPAIPVLAADKVALTEIRQIVVPAKAHSTEQSMARVLQRKLNQLYRINPTITDDSNATGIASGGILLGRKLAISHGLISSEELEAVKFDGYIIRSRGNRIAIAGYQPQGTIYGTHAFLRRAGLKAYPNRDFGGLEIGQPHEDGIMPALDVASRPYFENRDLLGHLDRGRWGATIRELGGMGDFGFIRNHEWFKPRGWLGGDHTAPYLVPMAKYGREHPEYYAFHGKTRIPPDTPNVRTTLCLSNPDVHRIAAERALEWMGIQKGSRFFYITDGDSRACRCGPCQALDPMPKIVSDRKLRWVNTVAKAVKPAFPDKVVVALAYGENTKAPIQVKPESNVVILYCPWLWNSRSTSSVTWANPQNITAMREFMDLVLRFPGQIGVYDYPSGWVQGQADRLKFLAKNGVRVFHANGGTGDLFQWVNINLLWDPFLDVTPLIDEFMAAAYGPAAEPMREWYRIQQTAIEQNVIHTRDPFTTPEFARDGRMALATAIEQSARTDQKTRARILADVLIGQHLILRKTHPLTGVPAIRTARPAYEADLESFVKRQKTLIGLYEELGMKPLARRKQNAFAADLGKLGLDVTASSSGQSSTSSEGDVFDRAISTIDELFAETPSAPEASEASEASETNTRTVNVSFGAASEWLVDGSQASLISPAQSATTANTNGVHFDAPFTKLPVIQVRQQKIHAGRFFAERKFTTALDATDCPFLDLHVHATADVPITLYVNNLHSDIDLHAGEQIVRIDFRNFRHPRFEFATWDKKISRLAIDLWPQDNYHPHPQAQDVSLTVFGLRLQNRNPSPTDLPWSDRSIWLSQSRANIPRGINVPRELWNEYLQRQHYKHAGLDYGSRYITERFRSYTDFRVLTPITSIVASNADETTARLLQSELEKKFQIRLPIRSKNANNAFLLGGMNQPGDGQIEQRALKHVGEGGFVINAHNGRVAIAGNDPLGTSLGVSRYLKDHRSPGDPFLHELYLLDRPWFTEQFRSAASATTGSAVLPDAEILRLAGAIKQAARNGDQRIPDAVLQKAQSSSRANNLVKRLLWNPFADSHRSLQNIP